MRSKLTTIGVIFWVCAAVVSVTSAYTLLKTDDLWANVVLKRAMSPYLASEDVVIRKGVNVTIEPGVEIRFAKGKHLVVQGLLNARGTEQMRIRFTKLTDEDANILSGFNKTTLSPPTAYPANFDNRNMAYENTFRLVEGETIFDGKLQILYNSKWHYVCSTHFKYVSRYLFILCVQPKLQ